MWVQKQKLSDVVMDMSLDFVIRIRRATICGVVLERDLTTFITRRYTKFLKTSNDQQFLATIDLGPDKSLNISEAAPLDAILC